MRRPLRDARGHRVQVVLRAVDDVAQALADLGAVAAAARGGPQGGHHGQIQNTHHFGRNARTESSAAAGPRSGAAGRHSHSRLAVSPARELVTPFCAAKHRQLVEQKTEFTTYWRTSRSGSQLEGH